MKRFVRTLCLLLLPILLYYALFLWLEPNNYFGLRSTTPSGTVLGALREYEKDPVNSIIVGDSRLAHFDMEEVEKTAGRPFGNLAYGGASLKESIDLLEWWMEKYPDINEVVFGLTFYTLNTNYAYDRVESIKETLYNPFAYLTNLSFHLETLEQFRALLRGDPLYGGDHETEDPADYIYEAFTTPTGETVQLRTRIAQYVQFIQANTKGWQPNAEEFDRLLEVINECTKKGVRFVVVLPPTHPAIFEYVVQDEGIEAPMLSLLQRLQTETDAIVLDYEISALGRPAFAEDMYFDGFHLDAERGLPKWTSMLFTDIDLAEGENPAHLG